MPQRKSLAGGKVLDIETAAKLSLEMFGPSSTTTEHHKEDLLLWSTPLDGLAATAWSSLAD